VVQHNVGRVAEGAGGVVHVGQVAGQHEVKSSLKCRMKQSIEAEEHEVDGVEEHFDSLAQRLDRIEATLNALVDRQMVRDWYTTEEVAQILGRAEFTVREWCRLGRIKAEKKGSGRGKHQAWVIAHDELPIKRNA
jgi:hypothetical protein